MAYRDHIRRCNSWTPERYRPFFAGLRQVGWVRHDNAAVLKAYPQVFRVMDQAVSLEETLDTPKARTEAVQAVVQDLSARGVIGRFRGEDFAVKTAWSHPEAFRLDRAAVPFFGVKAYGVHVNGFVRRGDGGLDLWIGQRAEDKPVEPGKFDNLVAGGQPAGLTLRENLAKEAAEEAGMEADLVSQAVSVGAVTYCMDDELGMKADTMFIFDLDLPDPFVPRNTDGEVAAFQRWPIERVLDVLRETQDFKFNVALVLLDFAMRHGVLAPDETPDYDLLSMGLHRLHPGLD